MKHALRRLALPLVAVPFAAPALAQRTFVVDMAGGAGSQFTEIQPAIDAADPGDIILVRPATGPTPYSGFIVDKALRILGDPRAKVGPGGGAYAMQVRDLDPGEVVVLQGLEEDYVHPYSIGLGLVDNQGSVHCEDLQVLFFAWVEDTNQASFQDCTLADVHVSGSQVVLSNTTAYGFYNYNCQCRIHALDLEDGSRVTVAGGRYLGPDAVSGLIGPGPAILVDGTSRLVVTGDFDTRIRAGIAGYGAGSSAIHTNGGPIVIDPDPALIPSGGLPPIAGVGEVTEVRIPYFHTSLDGDQLTLTVETWAGASVQLYVSSFKTPFPFRPTTPDVWVGMPNRVATGTAPPATGIYSRTFTMPSLTMPSLAAGLSFPMQAVVTYNGKVYLSNPVVAVVAPAP